MERRLTAILAADVVGYSRLMGADEAGTLAALKAVRTELIDGKIAQHQGRIVKLTGDGILAEFPSVVNALACASEVQRGVRERNTDVPQNRRIEFRVGVNVGDVIVEGDDIYGDGVNVASRLESVADPGGITVSQAVRDHVGNRLDLAFEDRGEEKLKNIEKPVHVYSVILEDANDGNMTSMKQDRPSIAVLPFNNMSGDPEQEYFSDGITEDIITDLSKVSGLSVIARHSSFSYKGKPLKVQQIGRELGVDFMLEGSVRKAGARVRVTGQLVNCKKGSHVWAERFDRDLTDIFAIQDEITHAIVEQLKVRLLPQEREAVEQIPTENIEAYTYCLRGRDFYRRYIKHYLQLGRRMFAKAVELDPLYARAYAGMADCDSFLRYYYRFDISTDSILALADKALSLDEALPEVHASRGFALLLAHRPDEAVAEFERAIALDPSSFEAHYLYGRLCHGQGKIEKTAALFERAAEINPDDLNVPTFLTHVYRSLGRDEARLRWARRTVEIAERQLALYPDDARPPCMGIEGLIELGETNRAREWISRALALEPDDPTVQYNVACGLTKLGELEWALDLLEHSLRNAPPEMISWVKHDADLDSLRNHPRYQEILELIEQT
ncbi:MAG: adenylate/guanylate cyclase domain-containing protein [Verrucomicrobia bacterium]|nr:MAG: adenylate/guanylate cyclase domain-containing protein [Verrucomicrobiota bacterium]PYL43519.1 MAG: adenylate/guanylate cyclase domain-containing protein [Verrucomicrobiota bacterium]